MTTAQTQMTIAATAMASRPIRVTLPLVLLASALLAGCDRDPPPLPPELWIGTITEPDGRVFCAVGDDGQFTLRDVRVTVAPGLEAPPGGRTTVALRLRPGERVAAGEAQGLALQAGRNLVVIVLDGYERGIFEPAWGDDGRVALRHSRTADALRAGRAEQRERLLLGLAAAAVVVYFAFEFRRLRRHRRRSAGTGPTAVDDPGARPPPPSPAG